MKNIKKAYLSPLLGEGLGVRLLLALLLLPISMQAKKWTKQQVYETITRVNNYWQQHNRAEVRSFWDNAAYHTGNMEVYKLLKDESQLAYTIRWAEHNNWSGATEPDPAKWLYKKYGESQQHVLFGDWQICFQTYIDLYLIEERGKRKEEREMIIEERGKRREERGEGREEREMQDNLSQSSQTFEKTESESNSLSSLPSPLSSKKMISRAKEVMHYEAYSQAHDYWWWADALYMVMPVMTKMYKLTGDEQYLNKLYENILYSDSIMLDPETGLYFRDGKYVYPKHKSANGQKDFWARGDGWVLAGLAKVLQDMPKTYRHYDFFLEKYKTLAAAVAKIQQPEGYWTRSMLDPAHAPGPETSGTAFFTYGLLWGVNNGILAKKTYKKTIDRAWQYLTETALQPSGKIGYVQPIGERAIPGQTVDANSEANFGVGAFLLAACEYAGYLKK